VEVVLSSLLYYTSLHFPKEVTKMLIELKNPSYRLVVENGNRIVWVSRGQICLPNVVEGWVLKFKICSTYKKCW